MTPDEYQRDANDPDTMPDKDGKIGVDANWSHRAVGPMTYDQAVEAVLIHAVACSSVMFAGMVPNEVIEALEPRCKKLTEKFGANIVHHTVHAIELLTTFGPSSDELDVVIDPEEAA